MVVVNSVIDFTITGKGSKKYSKSDSDENSFKDVFAKVSEASKKTNESTSNKKTDTDKNEVKNEQTSNADKDFEEKTVSDENTNEKDKVKNNETEDMDQSSNEVKEEATDKTNNEGKDTETIEKETDMTIIEDLTMEEQKEQLENVLVQFSKLAEGSSSSEKIVKSAENIIAKIEKSDLTSEEKTELLGKVEDILNKIEKTDENNTGIKFAQQMLKKVINELNETGKTSNISDQNAVDNKSQNVSKETINEQSSTIKENRNSEQIQTKASSEESDSEDSKDNGQRNSDSKIQIHNLKTTQDFNSLQNEKVINMENIIQNTNSLKEDINNAINVKNADQSEASKNVFKQVVETIDITLKDGKTEMSANLKPDHLGKLNFEMVSEKGIIVAKFTAESQQVKEIIEANLPALKDALEEKGISVQGFSVSVGDDSSQQRQKAYNLMKNNKKIKIKNESIITSKLIENNQLSYSNDNYGYYASSSVDYTA